MGALAQVLRGLPRPSDPNLLVGTEFFDDAGVYRIDASTGIVLTLDFFPPLVDDPFIFGQIAAANALSDIYAMGGTPLAVLNIVGFPDKDLPVEILAEILRGGAERVAAAGAVVAGGHSVRDSEIKYGLSVTGRIDPNRILTNAGAQPGDVLILTKPIGTAQLTTAAKQGKISQDDLSEAIASMIELNKGACEAIMQLGEEFGIEPLPEPQASACANEPSSIAHSNEPRAPASGHLNETGEPRTECHPGAPGIRADHELRGATHGQTSLPMPPEAQAERNPGTPGVRVDAHRLPPSQGGTQGGSQGKCPTSPNPLLGNEGGCRHPLVSVGGVHAVTDITGFGLLGHAMEMAQASGVTIEIDAAKVPLMTHALDLARAGVLTRAHKSNLECIGDKLNATGVDETLVKVLADAQTSGGLLIAVAKDRARQLNEFLTAHKTIESQTIGEVVPIKAFGIGLRP